MIKFRGMCRVISAACVSGIETAGVSSTPGGQNVPRYYITRRYDV